MFVDEESCMVVMRRAYASAMYDLRVRRERDPELIKRRKERDMKFKEAFKEAFSELKKTNESVPTKAMAEYLGKTHRSVREAARRAGFVIAGDYIEKNPEVLDSPQEP